jgi:predicted metal-dependent peptidase
MAKNSTTSNTKNHDEMESLIGKTDPAVDREARERIILSRISLLLKQPFFGNLATRMRIINADQWCETAATDGRNLYYNSRFIMKLRPKEVDFLIGHEVLHVVYDHIGRKEDRNHQIWNIANDYAVNADLKRHRIGEMITTVPCLYEPKYDGKSSEEIYLDLMKNAKKISLSDLMDQLLDDHMDSSQDGEGDGEGEDGNGDRPAKLSASEREQIRQEIKEAVISAAQNAGAGAVPDGVKRMIESFTNPTMPWRDLLNTNITSTVRNDYSWNRPSRRGWHVEAIMPGMTPGEEIDISVAIDMSGSISTKQATEFLTEVSGMMQSFDSYKIHVFSFDTEVYAPVDFTSENMEQIEEYVPQGGGGTDFTVIFKYLKENSISPKQLIVFTDGYPCGSWGDENYCDTTFVIHGSQDIKPPFGSWAYYDDHKK